MAIRTQTELMIHRVLFIRRTKEDATQAACAGNTRRYDSEYGIYGSIAGETMMRIRCFDHITTATISTPLPDLMKRMSHKYKVIYT